MRVDLTDNSKVDVEVCVQCLDWDIRSQTAVLPLVSKGVWLQSSISRLHHEDDGIEDTRNSSRGQYCRPDDAVRACQIIAKNGWRVRIGWNTGNVENTACSFIGLSERQGTMRPPAASSCPVNRI